MVELTCPKSSLIRYRYKVLCLNAYSSDADCGQEVRCTRGALNRNLAQTRPSNDDASDINRLNTLQSDDLHSATKYRPTVVTPSSDAVEYHNHSDDLPLEADGL